MDLRHACQRAVELNESEGNVFARMHLVTTVLGVAGDVDPDEVMEYLNVIDSRELEVGAIEMPEQLAMMAMLDSIMMVTARPELAIVAREVYGMFLQLLDLDLRMEETIAKFWED